MSLEAIEYQMDNFKHLKSGFIDFCAGSLGFYQFISEVVNFNFNLSILINKSI